MSCQAACYQLRLELIAKVCVQLCRLDHPVAEAKTAAFRACCLLESLTCPLFCGTGRCYWADRAPHACDEVVWPVHEWTLPRPGGCENRRRLKHLLKSWIAPQWQTIPA